MLSGGFMKNADDIMEKLGFIADYSTFKEINYYNKKIHFRNQCYLFEFRT